jgi:hypothetical protein
VTIHILVEGPSERAFLERWAGRLLKGTDFRVHPHQGKGTLPKGKAIGAKPSPNHRGLLDQLPAKLRAYAQSLSGTADGVLVLVDADDDDPELLRRDIEAIITDSGVARAKVALAIEETEAFYLGDLNAIQNAFPEANMKRARAYVPDSICGTWELFGEVVRDGGGNKVTWAEAMGPLVTVIPAKSRSPSFKRMLALLVALIPASAPKLRPRRYRHATRSDRDRTGRR